MWLLENSSAFEGRRLWLRPGKTYLFGRTAAEPGQLTISHNTISRKHLTIAVAAIGNGNAHHPTNRPKVTIEDLATKIGTVVNGRKIKGDTYVVQSEDSVDIIMGKSPSTFRLVYLPVVLTFSFTSKELQTDPLTSLRERFEPLDVKLLVDYNTTCTTHVVSRKRNTAKGLQALINGKYIVTESFLHSITQSTESTTDETGAETCALEQDFDKHWPDPLQHLPPRGAEPFSHPDTIYSPDITRQNVFEGYTFVFYDQVQYTNLLAPITDGGGKALYEHVTPGVTLVDDFVRYVKSVAGEKGLGRFEDGSEGRGVVLVRYLPAKGEHTQWYGDFFTSVSLLLDHRPIEQNEFLEAILINNASMLRRPLEVDDATQTHRQLAGSRAHPRDADETAVLGTAGETSHELRGVARRGRGRGPVKRRFAGFDEEADVDMDDIQPASNANAHDNQDAEGGLFISQEDDEPEATTTDRASQSRRKRAAASVEEDDLMDGLAPAAARYKRQRIARGEDGVAAPIESQAPTKAVQKKKAKEIDVLATAARHREEEEAKARAEEEDLAFLPEDIDLAEIRRLNIVEEMEMRVPENGPRSREQDIANGRWDPKWNGIKNFKKFRRRGEAMGRQPPRVIVPLTEVKKKEFGVGDSYWLEEESSQQRHNSTVESSRQSLYPLHSIPQSTSSRAQASVLDIASTARGSEAEDDSQPPVIRGTRRGTTQTTPSGETQSSALTNQSLGKRAAPTESLRTQATKRQKPAIRPEIADSDSDDELKFRFGRRR